MIDIMKCVSGFISPCEALGVFFVLRAAEPRVLFPIHMQAECTAAVQSYARGTR